MKEILFCSPRGRVGGICRWTDNILAYAEDAGDEDVSLSWYYTEVPPMALGHRSAVRRLLDGVRTYLPFISGLRGVLRSKRYDMAHFSTSGGISFSRDYLALRLCRKKGLRTALHFHFGRMPQVLKSSSLERRLFDMCLPYIDEIVTMDRATCDALVEYGCANVHYVPNPLSQSVEKMIESSGEQGRTAELVVYAGHVLATKGVFELVEACRDIGGVKLVLMGQCTDEMRQELLRLGGVDAEKWLEIPGNCSLKEVIAAMKRCAVFVLPSYSEGFPNVIIEAMACAAPIVATSVGAIPQMLATFEGRPCGITVAPQNVPELKAAIEKVISEPAASLRMGHNACLKVHDNYAMPRIWAELKKIWTK